MTTEEKKAALKEAGIKVRSNASDETIEEMFDERLAETETETETSAPSSDRIAAFNAFLAANADPMAGDKTPVVVAYARKNLTPEEFNERYAGRKFEA